MIFFKGEKNYTKPVQCNWKLYNRNNRTNHQTICNRRFYFQRWAFIGTISYGPYKIVHDNLYDMCTWSIFCESYNLRTILYGLNTVNLIPYMTYLSSLNRFSRIRAIWRWKRCPSQRSLWEFLDSSTSCCKKSPKKRRYFYCW